MEKKKTRIKIKDLPKDQKMSKEEMKKAMGGIIDDNKIGIIDDNKPFIIDDNKWTLDYNLKGL